MTTNKPEALPVFRAAHELSGDTIIVRLTDYKALQAECEKLRDKVAAPEAEA